MGWRSALEDEGSLCNRLWGFRGLIPSMTWETTFDHSASSTIDCIKTSMIWLSMMPWKWTSLNSDQAVRQLGSAHPDGD